MTETKKSNSVVTVSYRPDGLMAIAVLGAGEVVFDKTKASQTNRLHAEDHGWEQRLRDAAAIPRDTETGKSATPQEKYDAIKDLADFYMAGGEEWTRAGQGGGGKSLTVEAIARVKGVEYDQAEAYVADYAAKHHGGDTKKALAFLRQGARIMAAMDEIRKARTAAPKVDADAALEELA